MPNSLKGPEVWNRVSCLRWPGRVAAAHTAQGSKYISESVRQLSRNPGAIELSVWIGMLEREPEANATPSQRLFKSIRFMIQ